MIKIKGPQFLRSTSCLLILAPDRTVLVQVLSGDIVLGQDTFLQQTGECNGGGGVTILPVPIQGGGSKSTPES